MAAQNLPAPRLRLLPAEVEQAEVRAQRAPWTAMSLLLVAASAERMAAHLSGHEAELAYGTAAAAFVAAILLTTKTKSHPMTKALRRRFLAAVWGAAGWLTYVAACGLTWGTTATLLTVGSLLSLLYWSEHRIYGRPPTVVMEPVADEDLYAVRWTQHLGGKGKKLAGSRLTERVAIKSGYRYTLELVPGTQTVDQVQAMVATIRGALNLMPGQDVVIEAHPENPEPDALITIVTRSTVKVDQEWPGPELSFSPKLGSAVMGPHVDGEGCAHWATYRANGMFGGFIQGCQGSGKSRLLESIALSLASSTTHPTIVWYADGQNGSSSTKVLRPHADYPAVDAESCLAMLEDALKVMRFNNAWNRKYNLDGFTPTEQRPGLLVIVDEFHNFLDEAKTKLARKIQDAMVTIVREGRKVGVALVLATQEPLLGAFGHPSKADLLRSCLLAGNGVMMRSETQNARMVFDVSINPRRFPQLPGYGYLARPAEGQRQAPFRGFYLTDRVIERWARTVYWRTLNDFQARFLGDSYVNRRANVDRQTAADDDLLDRLMAGTYVEPVYAAAVMDEPRVQTRLVAPSTADGIPAIEDVVKFFEKTPAPMHEPTAAERSMPESQVQVLNAIRRGVASPKELVAHTGYSPSAVHLALAELEARGAVNKPRTGRYSAVA